MEQATQEEETLNGQSDDGGSRRSLSRRGRVLIAFTFFSMFFGAGNLIFPPIVGAQAGSMTWAAALGFIVSGVGLPILGVLAVTTAGGFDRLAGRVSKNFSLVLGLVIILTIGPCFAIPRTATTSFEMAVTPFAHLVPGVPQWLLQLLYSLIFFAVAYVLAQHPDRLASIIGKFMGPLLLLLIAVLFVGCIATFNGTIVSPNGDYSGNQAVRGFLDGYQTMDMLAALYFGIVISANISAMGVSGESNIRKETALGGISTGVLLALVYAVLSYIGAVSGSFAPVDSSKDTGATVLTNLTTELFGAWGTAFVGLIFLLACLNVCTGLISTVSVYFQERFPSAAHGKMTYRMWSTLFTLFSLLVSNIGLSMIIKVSLPVLSALYPVAIILVFLSLLHTVFSGKFPRVYFWTVLCVGIVSVAQCVASMAVVFGGGVSWLESALAVLPLDAFQLGWVVPAAIGAVVGVVDSLVRVRRSVATR
jgi:LIVCS family branched-chain amino acid:cation transporter